MSATTYGYLAQLTAALPWIAVPIVAAVIAAFIVGSIT